VLQRDPSGLELRADPAALAPERLLVFEVRGAISTFAAAVRRVPGLELIDEEELEVDENDKSPVAYLMVPDVRALRDLESLWRRWQRDALILGETPWRDVFALLRDLRPWGPTDRVQPKEVDILQEEIFGLSDVDFVKLEIELVYRRDSQIGSDRENEARVEIAARGGRIVSQSRIDDIAYHALLVELPVSAIREIIGLSPLSLAGLESALHIRPQSVASTIQVGDFTETVAGQMGLPSGEPIIALLDGVPMAGHSLLSSHLVVDDQFGLEPATPVSGRVHGTAMASLIIHGDRNRVEPSLPRQIHVVPILGANDRFPDDQLIVDIVYRAVLAMRGEINPTAPNVLIINLSLGNLRRPFSGQLSAWARLLDRLAYRFGILFIVSAGNHADAFSIAAYPDNTQFESAPVDQRAAETIRALGSIVADRRILSPAETVNGLTVGAINADLITEAARASARVNVDPYVGMRMANPSSALGPGFAQSTKPDVLMPGAREHLRFDNNLNHLQVRPAAASRFAGLKVAAPPQVGRENSETHTSGTSAAAALTSRTCHLIHDALEFCYGDIFRNLTHIQRAVLLKALVAHTASWPDEAARLIKETIGPFDARQHVRQKDNIRRFLGFGIVDSGEAVACAADRATFWATGTLERDKTSIINVPVPIAMAGQVRSHALFATLAWFTPTSPGLRSYRSVRLKLLEPQGLDALRIKAGSNQPDGNQTNRGTLFSRCWSGNKAPVIGPDMSIQLIVQRDPDQGTTIDEAVPFGLAVTLTMPGVMQIYEQVSQRLGIIQPIRTVP
jgi:hypothetical protein